MKVLHSEARLLGAEAASVIGWRLRTCAGKTKKQKHKQKNNRTKPIPPEPSSDMGLFFLFFGFSLLQYASVLNISRCASCRG